MVYVSAPGGRGEIRLTCVESQMAVINGDRHVLGGGSKVCSSRCTAWGRRALGGCLDPRVRAVRLLVKDTFWELTRSHERREMGYEETLWMK